MKSLFVLIALSFCFLGLLTMLFSIFRNKNCKLFQLIDNKYFKTQNRQLPFTDDMGKEYVNLGKKIIELQDSQLLLKSAIEKLEHSQKLYQKDFLELDNKIIEFLDKQLYSQVHDSGGRQPDHTLALKVADEIVRIENNLSRMDTSVRGYRQLIKAVERIRDNFMANGYEIVKMLGEPYNEGMKAEASFESNESLAEGEQIITGITRPQVNFNGKMIQCAKIIVSQNQ